MSSLTDDQIVQLALKPFEAHKHPLYDSIVLPHAHNVLAQSRFIEFARAVIAAHEAHALPRVECSNHQPSGASGVCPNCGCWGM